MREEGQPLAVVDLLFRCSQVAEGKREGQTLLLLAVAVTGKRKKHAEKKEKGEDISRSSPNSFVKEEKNFLSSRVLYEGDPKKKRKKELRWRISGCWSRSPRKEEKKGSLTPRLFSRVRDRGGEARMREGREKKRGRDDFSFSSKRRRREKEGAKRRSGRIRLNLCRPCSMKGKRGS